MRHMPSKPTERRRVSDRRRQPRGGRRPGDRDGYAPLVLVADDDHDSAARCEAILARLKFAVAPARTADEAIRVMQVLRPNIVVSHLKDGQGLERSMASDPAMADVPVLVLTPATAAPEALVEEIRRVLRKHFRD
jgi:PleD family two-component response regulator